MSTLITVLITIVACQLILFVLMLLGKEDDEKVLIVLCGIWSIFGFTILRGVVQLYHKLNTIWFNKNFTRCRFYGFSDGSYSIIYVRNTEIDKLNKDNTKRYYIEEDPKPLKSLYYAQMHIRRNKGRDFINDIDNPPSFSGFSKEYVANWKK